MAALLFVSFGSGSVGVTSLQTAYAGGNTIDVVDGTPVDLRVSTAPSLHTEISPGGIRMSLGGSAFVVGGLDDAEGQLVILGGADMVTPSNEPHQGGGTTIRSGAGSDAVDGDNEGGDAGAIFIQAATGGAGDATGVGGDGGSLSITSGTGGNSGAGDRGDGGEIAVTAGGGDSGGNVVITAGEGDFLAGGAALQSGVLTGIGTGSFSRVGAGPASLGLGGTATMVAGSATGEESGVLNGADITLGGGANTASGAGTNTGGFVRIGGGIANEDPTSLGGDVILAAGQGGAIGGSAYLSAGFGADGTTSGKVSIGLNASIGLVPDVDGGVLFDSNGIAYLRTHDVGAPESGDTTGSLKLHILTDLEEDRLDPLEDGLIHLRTVQGDGGPRNIGFRAREAGAWGLMGRGFQTSFSGDGIENTFQFEHNLNTFAPLVQVYHLASPFDKVSDAAIVISFVDGDGDASANDIRVLFTSPEETDYYITILGF